MKRIILDLDEVVQLARSGATDAEIAAFYPCRHTTITFRAHKQLARGRLLMQMDIRKAQIDLAKSGNSAMLAFLGKEYLGQTGKPREEEPEEDTAPAVSTDELQNMSKGK